VATEGSTDTPAVMAFRCPDCDAPRPFSLVHKHSRYLEEADLPEEYSYVVCRVCAAPMLLVRENYGEGFEGAHHQVYPSLRRQIRFSVPLGVSNSYEEAVKCEGAKAWMGTVVMVGRALEAICKDFDPSVKSIQDGLRKMLQAGAISQEMYDWGDGLRVVRNVGAHATTERVSPTDARHSLDFLQALIEILFDLRVRFAEWQDERAKRAAAKAARRASIGPTPVALSAEGSEATSGGAP
jgi:Domain of unknown function (DUF4145)